MSKTYNGISVYLVLLACFAMACASKHNEQICETNDDCFPNESCSESGLCIPDDSAADMGGDAENGENGPREYDDWTGQDECSPGGFDVFLNGKCVVWDGVMRVEGSPSFVTKLVGDMPPENNFDIYLQTLDEDETPPLEFRPGHRLTFSWDTDLEEPGSCPVTTSEFDGRLTPGTYLIVGPNAAAGVPVQCEAGETPRFIVIVEATSAEPHYTFCGDDRPECGAGNTCPLGWTCEAGDCVHPAPRGDCDLR